MPLRLPLPVSLRLAGLLAGVALVTGCFVFDEIDKGKEMMGESKREKKQETAAADEEKPDPRDAWWQKARNLEQKPLDGFVSCKLGDVTHYMREPDCLARGGRPGRIGG